MRTLWPPLVDGCAAYILLLLLYLFLSPFLLKIAFLRRWALPPYSPPSFLTLSFRPQSALLTGRTGAVMDDALSESDNIFSQSPKRDRAASEAGLCWSPFSVCEVHLLCPLTPLTTPISAALALCKLELTTPPRPFNICTAAAPRRLTSFQLPESK